MISLFAQKRCKSCSKDLLFLSHYTINGKIFCFTCYSNGLKKLNGNKKLPKTYGFSLRILEKMFELSLDKYKVISNKQLRLIAIKLVKKEFYN